MCAHTGAERGINIVTGFIQRGGPTRRQYNVMAISSQPKLKGHTDERSRNASRIEPIFIFQQNTELLPKAAESTRTLGKNTVLTQQPMEQKQRCRGKPGRQEGRATWRSERPSVEAQQFRLSSVQGSSYVVVSSECVLSETRHGNWIKQTTMWCDFQVSLLCYLYSYSYFVFSVKFSFIFTCCQRTQSLSVALPHKIVFISNIFPI